MSHDGEGATKTTATVHMLFNDEWGYETDHMTELRPSCGRWNCVMKAHWSPVRRKSDRERLREIVAAYAADREEEMDQAIRDAASAIGARIE
jgi:hypothetical protein